MRPVERGDVPVDPITGQDLARSRGYWSVWMTVFSDDPDMRRRLIAGFKGTAAGCFDANADALPRAGGAL